jgi:rubrerythrin
LNLVSAKGGKMDVEEYRKILSLAINREIESYTFYRGIADKVKD